MATEDYEKTIWYLKNVVGVSDEDLSVLTQDAHRSVLLEKFPELLSYEVVATVVDNPKPVNCSAQLKVGQTLIFDLMPAMLNVRDSSCPLCSRAIAPLARVIPQFWGVIASGGNPDPMRVGCDDQGIQEGGLGHVEFEVLIKKKQAASL